MCSSSKMNKYGPGGGGGGLVGVPVFGGRAGGTSELGDWPSSWNRFLLLMPNWSAPFDWNTRFTPNWKQIYKKKVSILCHLVDTYTVPHSAYIQRASGVLKCNKNNLIRLLKHLIYAAYCRRHLSHPLHYCYTFFEMNYEFNKKFPPSGIKWVSVVSSKNHN